MEEKNKKVILIFVIVFLLIVISGLLLVILTKKQKARGNETSVDYYNEYQAQRASQGLSADDAKPEVESNENQYYTVKSIIDKFNMYVSYLDATVEDLNLIVDDDEEAEMLKEYKNNGLNAISNILAHNYKAKYSVDNNYIEKMLKPFAKKSYKITDMYVVKDSSYINTYFVYGNYSETEFNYIIVLDKYNYTYEIYLNNYLADNKYSKKEVSSMKTLHIQAIEANDFNKFQYKEINKETIAGDYYNEYLNMMLTNPEQAYNLLDNSYKTKRFKSLDSFKQFVSTVINTKFKRNMLKYSKTTGNTGDEYVCQDSYGNNYIFKASGVGKYTVVLDAYTVPVEAYDSEYKQGDTAKKVQLCLNRFFEALNNKDYETAYSFLNSNYKKDNFKTVDEFKDYVRKNWFEFNSFNYTKVETSNDAYIIDGTLADITTVGNYNAKYYDKSFVLRLGDDVRHFEVSFEK